MYWVKKESENPVVTNYYLDTIAIALSQFDKVNCFINWEDAGINKKRDMVIVCTAPDALMALLKGYKYIFWSQGCWPEESFMRNKSRIRMILCNIVEKIALNRANFVFLVSESMKKYYENKYKLEFKERCYIMPCSNDKIHKEAFLQEKYDNNVFCYAGGTSVWQCFEETIRLYSEIENNIVNTKLLLFVKENEYVKNILNKYQIKNYAIDYVSVDELPKKLAEAKYGFVLRDDSPVNYVATPTKVLTYMAAGVIPIFSSSLEGIKTVLHDSEYKIICNDIRDASTILEHCNMSIDCEKIYNDYMLIYEKYYDRDNNVKRIRRILEKIKIN